MTGYIICLYCSSVMDQSWLQLTRGQCFVCGCWEMGLITPEGGIIPLAPPQRRDLLIQVDQEQATTVVQPSGAPPVQAAPVASTGPACQGCGTTDHDVRRIRQYVYCCACCIACIVCTAVKPMDDFYTYDTDRVGECVACIKVRYDDTRVVPDLPAVYQTIAFTLT